MALGWKLLRRRQAPRPRRTSSPRTSGSRGAATVGLGAQHVVAMFGATFVFPLIMGLNPQLAIMMSGIATICFLLIVKGKVPELPRHLGVLRRRRRGDPRPGRRLRRRHRRDPGRRRRAGRSSACSSTSSARGAAQGAAAGRHRRRRHADRLQPRAGRRQHLLAAGPVGRAARHDRSSIVVRGRPSRASSAASRSSSALIFGYVLSWLFDKGFGQITVATTPAPARSTTHFRVNLDGVKAAPLVRLPAARPIVAARTSSAGTSRRSTWPSILLVLPGRDRADRREHRPRQGGRRDDQDRPRPLHGPGHRRRRRRHRPRHRGRRLADHDVRREHRRHGGDPGLLHGGLLRRRARGDPVRPLPEVRRARRVDPGRRPRRHHRRALRHDRPARRQDLEGERGRLRQPDQPRAGRRGHHHRHRRRHAEVHRQLHALRHRARHHRGDRRLPPGPGPGAPRAARPRRRRRQLDGTPGRADDILGNVRHHEHTRARTASR